MNQPLLQLSCSLWKKALDTTNFGPAAPWSIRGDILATRNSPAVGYSGDVAHRMCYGVCPPSEAPTRCTSSAAETKTASPVRQRGSLQGAGVIEKVDASPWVSLIVVTSKKNGKICVSI